MDHPQPAEPEEAEEQDTAPAEDGTVTLSGDAARAAARPHLRWFRVDAIVLAIALLGGWLLWHRSAHQEVFLLLGVSLLLVAGLFAQHGVVGFSYSTGQETTFTLRRSSMSRWIAAPGLALAGVVLIVAATSTHIGSAAAAVANAGLVVLEFGKAAWELLLSLALLVAAMLALVRPGERAAGVFLLGLYALGGLVLSVVYLLSPGAFHQMWDEAVHPYREMWRLLAGG